MEKLRSGDMLVVKRLWGTCASYGPFLESNDVKIYTKLEDRIPVPCGTHGAKSEYFVPLLSEM